MGTACTRESERVAASQGLLIDGATPIFEKSFDVPRGGVLCAIPALLASGLLTGIKECFPKLTGYYNRLHIFLLLAYMALTRIKSVNNLQKHSPGELGNLMGLDRVPEVKRLRVKLEQLTRNNEPEKWSSLLSRKWMVDTPELTGVLYVDGHMRIYNGGKTNLPRKFVSRQRLCLPGILDFWVNDILGQPFFLVNRPINKGMIEALHTDILPRLLKDIPNQPSEEQLKADSSLCRFILVFDREGYSPKLFKDLWENHRIGCITYHKYPKKLWAEDDFQKMDVFLPRINSTVSMKLASRETTIGTKKNEICEVLEIRKLNGRHQTSIVSTVKNETITKIAGLLFNRWSQENFFRYMMKHFAIDSLSEYGVEAFPATQTVINPEWRQLNKELKSLNAKLKTRHANYTKLILAPDPDEKKMDKWISAKAAVLEEIEQYKHSVTNTKTKLKGIKQHIYWEDLPTEEKFMNLPSSLKCFTDTIKMIAFRAETSMMSIVREKYVRKDNIRDLLVALFKSDADIIPDKDSGTLTVRVHRMASNRDNEAILHLLDHLNMTETNFPGTQLRLIYEMVGTEKKT